VNSNDKTYNNRITVMRSDMGNSSFSIKAYAKINLALDVLGKLPNGYHEVKMIMQTVGIYDELIFEKKDSEIEIITDSGELPVNEDNLIYKAAKLLMDKYGIKEGIRIKLEKNIPIAAGMAGGSTDAAAALKGVNRMFGLGCTDEELKRAAVNIGADVPYCIMGGTALAEGIGERLMALPKPPECVLLVAKPGINVSTRYVYEHLDALEEYEHPDVDGMIENIAAGNLDGIVKRMGNVLEGVTIPAHPVIDAIKKTMLESGALGSMMSGSGPTVFGIYDDSAKAEKGFKRIKEEGLAGQVFITEFV
jgi:4-diphosphocytidyl-2-C-methyl-D-erythritol kinase